MLANSPLKADMIADVSSSSTCASWVDRPPVSCDASCDWLVEMGSIHFSHLLTNSASTTSQTSSAHWTTCRITWPVVFLKSGRR